AGLSWVSGWAALVLLPTLGYLMLSSYEPQFSFTSQYSAPLVPLVIGTAILGLASGSDPVPTCAGSSHGGELARFELGIWIHAVLAQVRCRSVSDGRGTPRLCRSCRSSHPTGVFPQKRDSPATCPSGATFTTTSSRGCR